MEIKERGWAGHFICSDRCLFKRNTLIGDKYIVSTVGNMRLYDGNALEKIGCDRHYETMVWKASMQGQYMDCDIESGELDFDGLLITEENSSYCDNLADEMHERMVDKWNNQ